MAVLHGKHRVAAEICQALGLKNVRRLDIHLAADEVATVTAEFCATVENGMVIPAMLRKFTLQEIPEAAEKAGQRRWWWVLKRESEEKSWYFTKIDSDGDPEETNYILEAMLFATKDDADHYNRENLDQGGYLPELVEIIT